MSQGYPQHYTRLFKVPVWEDPTSLTYGARMYLMGKDGESTPMDLPSGGGGAQTFRSLLGPTPHIGIQSSRLHSPTQMYSRSAFQNPSAAVQDTVLNATSKYVVPPPGMLNDANQFIRNFGYVRVRR